MVKMIRTYDELIAIVRNEGLHYVESLLNSPSVFERLHALSYLEIEGYIISEDVIYEVICKNGARDESCGEYERNKELHDREADR